MGQAGTVVILAAGQGTRMRSKGPKVLHPLCGRPLIGWVLEQARALEPETILVVTGHGGEALRAWIGEHERDARVRFVTQAEQRGTGHAVQQCAGELARARGPVVVLYGDMPCLAAPSLAALVAAAAGAGAAVLTATPSEARGFGRILRGPGGEFRGVVEERDATSEQRALREVNVGVYAFEREALLRALPRLRADNAQGEYYLTDVPALLLADGLAVAAHRLQDEREAIGINDLRHLSEARAVIQERILRAHLENGVFVEDPATTYVEHGVEIGEGTKLLPCTVVRAGVRIGRHCEVGPFTHLRAGTVLEDHAEVGNFTEAKNSRIGSHTKAKHLSYLGDADVGAGANIGAGTIFANFDGKAKHRTTVGDGAFVGSGTVLIAPCRVGAGALTGGGAVVTRDTSIPAGEAWVGVPARPLAGRKRPAGTAPADTELQGS
jgi:bifunctional UDP-N-acetylglucosamine pyrophosphorylase/glucosamine-1-phosphate N-acetyltransferase